ncbi:MAG: ABC transporter ATP-binding protein [Planctomycetia bacterium]
MSTPLFAIEGVTKRYGGLTAVQGGSLALQAGEVVGLIGPNGAGKTTCFNLMTGADTVTEGCVRWQGDDITALRDWQRARLGMARTFQNIRLWTDLSVRDNVRTVCRAAAQAGWLDGLLRTARHRRVEAEVSARADALLERLGVGGLAGLRAGDLPYGPQRKLEIARALALEPRLLLLDEPAAGMNPSEKADLMQVVLGLRKDLGLTVLVIEHDMRFVMGICERIVVLDHGELIGQGTPDEVRRDPRVVAAYLGGGA